MRLDTENRSGHPHGVARLGRWSQWSKQPGRCQDSPPFSSLAVKWPTNKLRRTNHVTAVGVPVLPMLKGKPKRGTFKTCQVCVWRNPAWAIPERPPTPGETAGCLKGLLNIWGQPLFASLQYVDHVLLCFYQGTLSLTHSMLGETQTRGS